jgi:DNA-binding IclR family transcriptional regulator
LAAGGYISRDPVSRTYRLGPSLVGLGEAARVHSGATPQIRAILGYLAQESGELANFAALDGMMAVYIAQAQPGPGPVTIFTRIGMRVPLYCTGVGKAMLAFLPEGYSRVLIDAGLRRYTSSTIVRAIHLDRELKRIRNDGYAIDNEEYEVGVRCVASPLRDRGGGVIGAISVSGPSTRMSSDRLPTLAKLVREASGVAWPQADGKPTGWSSRD